jgi:hypothetical protein
VRGEFMEEMCLLCERRAVGEVDVSVGLPAGMCRDHLDLWLEKHPELQAGHDVPG